jgi:hypothetical protein
MLRAPTLVDSVLRNQRSLQDALEKSGHRIPIQTLCRYSGLDASARGPGSVRTRAPRYPGGSS